MATKVVIENAVLHGSQQEQFWQKVATVYLDGGEEFNVVAPPKATGDALEWLKQFQVRSPTARHSCFRPGCHLRDDFSCGR
jgi:hypothetical protein